MTDAPDVDGRGEHELRLHVREIAPYYVPDWDPDEGGVGTGLVDIFAELAGGVVERLDAAPAKHRVAFYDALGFDAEPPQPARVPVQLRLDENAPRNVRVRPGTTALAETDEEVAFRVGEAAAFEATPARLTDVVAVDPAADAVFEHDGVIDGAGDETLFDGENVQAHAWYLGDADLLTVGAGTTVTVSLETTAEPAVVRDALVWEVHGEPGDDDPTDDGVADDPTDDGVEPTPDWYAIEDPVLVPETPDGVVAIDLELAGELTETTVDGVESKWIRAILPPDRTPDGPVAFQVDSVALGLGPEPKAPDQLLANDVPLAVAADGPTPIAPFGETPRLGDAFYLAAGDAFTKSGSRATITFHGNLDRDDGPTVSWEYWNGSGWAGLAALDDGTASFTHGAEDGVDVSFTVPPDLAATSVSGHEAHWIRARLVGGEFGQVSYREDEENERWVRVESAAPPRYDAVTIRYALANAARPNHVVTHNALAYAHVDPAGGSYRPFEALPESTQTLYLGFDRQLAGGPIQLFVDVADRAFPPWFAPRIRWERASDPLADAWVRIPAQDGTESLTERGIVALSFDESPLAFERFGTERHWIRARVRGTPFATAWSTASTTDETGGATAAFAAHVDSAALETAFESTLGDRLTTELNDPVAPDLDGGVATHMGNQMTAAVGRRLGDAHEIDGRSVDRRDRPRAGPRPCSEFVATEPPAGEPSTASPTVAGLFLNTGWARNVESVADEVLGGSDGERGQAFTVANPPVLEPTLWVDESSALSESQMSTLETARPGDVIREAGSDGAVRAFWVRWAHVDTFVDSDGSDRHYVLDRVEGRVRFGDGTRGRIPPRGTDNVRVSYVTGGGPAGNVPAGAVDDLKSGLPFVESVTNPVAGFGGAPAEETDDVLERAPRELRDRNRAVAPADFERLAVDASRLVARARCFAGMDRAGAYAPGWVTVLLVPDDGSERPTPSTGLLETVEESLSAHAPVALVARDRLVVRGPSYVGVGVDADVVVSKADTLGAIEERVEAALAAFLHPLTGGHDRTGWRFGELPSRSDVFAVLEGIAGVDHVTSLSLVFEGDGTVTSTEGVEPPTTSPDALVYGATHDLALRRAVGPGGGA